MNISVFMLIISLLLCSCVQKMTCPAYQSFFLHDKENLKRHFSYFKSDSIPKVRELRKDDHLIVAKQSAHKKKRMLMNIKMNIVYPPKFKDTLVIANDSLQQMFVEIDSTTQKAQYLSDTLASTSKVTKSQPFFDSTALYMITRMKEKYNIDQDNYMWYMRRQLVLPDIRYRNEQSKKELSQEQKDGGLKKFANFFKRKKRKKTKDSLEENVENSFIEDDKIDPGTKAD